MKNNKYIIFLQIKINYNKDQDINNLSLLPMWYNNSKQASKINFRYIKTKKKKLIQ